MINRILLSLLCLCAVAIVLPASEPPAFEPLVLALGETAPYPQARVTSVDATAGTLLFEWLDEDGARVDTGNSIARFTPLAPLAEGEPPPVPDNEILVAAIMEAAQ